MSTLSTNQPENINDLTITKYQLVFHKIPDVVFRCQSCNLPGLSVEFVNQPTPVHQVPVPGDSVLYNPLNITFIVDEDLENWKQLHDWMVGLGFPNSTAQFKVLKESDGTRPNFGGLYSDATLISLTNASIKNKQVIFKNCFPMELNDIDFDSSDTESGAVIGIATIKFMLYTIESL